MSGFKFVHAADLHIDSPLVGLARYEGAPTTEIRTACREAFEGLVRLAIEEEVAFVVLAGDLFDGDWPDFNTGAFFNQQLVKLERARIRVFLLYGNHDAQGHMTRSLRPPGNTHEFSHRAPETVSLSEHEVVLHGQSYAQRDVKTNLAAGYPRPVAGRFNIGVLHTALDGREGHESYAPCTVSDLEAKGYDYWALGHVHKREVVSRKPWVVFPGNIQGRSVRETGPKGCTVVTVSDGRVTEVRDEPLDVVRWASIEHDITGLDTEEDVMQALAEQVAGAARAADGRLLAARVRAIGTTKASAIRAEPDRWRADLVTRVTSLANRADDRAWIEKVLLDVVPPTTRDPASVENLAVLEGILAELARAPIEPRPDFVNDLQKRLGIDAPRGDDSPFTSEALARVRTEALELLRLKLRRAQGRTA